MGTSHDKTLCWKCANAVPDENHGCDWSRHGKPVPGWFAKETLGRKGEHYSWQVETCPEFIHDDYAVESSFDDEGVVNLANAIVQEAGRDYKLALAEYKECPRWSSLNAILSRMYRIDYSKECKKLYGRIAITNENQWRDLNKRIWEDEKFFQSEYAAHLTEANPKWIMDQIKEMVV